MVSKITYTYTYWKLKVLHLPTAFVTFSISFELSLCTKKILSSFVNSPFIIKLKHFTYVRILLILLLNEELMNQIMKLCVEFLGSSSPSSASPSPTPPSWSAASEFWSTRKGLPSTGRPRLYKVGLSRTARLLSSEQTLKTYYFSFKFLSIIVHNVSQI